MGRGVRRGRKPRCGKAIAFESVKGTGFSPYVDVPKGNGP